MIHEIQGLIWLQTPNGEATAKFLIDYGPESDIQWVCFQQNGEIWTWSNQEVRLLPNRTLGRKPAETAKSHLDIAMAMMGKDS